MCNTVSHCHYTLFIALEGFPFFFRQDDPYHVIVPLELRKVPHGHHNEPGAYQPQPHIKNKVSDWINLEIIGMVLRVPG